MKKLVLLLIIMLCASASYAGSDMIDRLLVIADYDGEDILVDQFINGTEDYYIATIVRPIESVNKENLSDEIIAATESISDLSDVLFRELNAYSKKEKSSMTLQRSLVKKPYYESSIFPNIIENPELSALTDDTLELKIWEAIAGAEGIGYNLLSDDHEPVVIDEKKDVIDTERYSLATRRDGMGVYVDTNSFVKTPDGCIAWIIEAIHEVDEEPYGETLTNVTGMPFQKVKIMMVKTEFDFSRPVCKTLRYVYFGENNRIIYSSLSAISDEINVSSDMTLENMYKHVVKIAPDYIK